MIKIVPVKDRHKLELLWPLPPQDPHWRAAPFNYIAHLLGHEGEGSILSVLKQRGWATALVAGPYHDGIDFSLMEVGIDLTDDGLEHVDEVIGTVFHYIQILKREGVVEWIFKEVRSLLLLRLSAF